MISIGDKVVKNHYRCAGASGTVTGKREKPGSDDTFLYTVSWDNGMTSTHYFREIKLA